jgi:hypothetical protein
MWELVSEEAHKAFVKAKVHGPEAQAKARDKVLAALHPQVEKRTVNQEEAFLA